MSSGAVLHSLANALMLNAKKLNELRSNRLLQANMLMLTGNVITLEEVCVCVSECVD